MTTRLEELKIALDKLPYDDRHYMENFLIGYIASSVPRKTWTDGISAALALFDKGEKANEQGRERNV